MESPCACRAKAKKNNSKTGIKKLLKNKYAVDKKRKFLYDNDNNYIIEGVVPQILQGIAVLCGKSTSMAFYVWFTYKE